MTTADASPRTPEPAGRFRLPDPPQREPDEMTSYDHLHKTGSSHYLALHFGNPETTLVEADRWMIAHPGEHRSRARRPDLLIAFDVDPVAYRADNGYMVSVQGKPPDFVMEVASESTADADVEAKRDEYAELGIAEYWRFDETGEFHGTRLAGDRLVDGQYVPVSIQELPDGSLQGHSDVLNSDLRWERGQLGWYDPSTGAHILTYDAQRERADTERESRVQQEARANREHQARVQAEARVRELEAELQRLRSSQS